MATVVEQMAAVRGDVLREDGLILRTCAHGVRHPVGRLHGRPLSERDVQAGHEVPGQYWMTPSRCCVDACCALWTEAPRPAA